MDKGSQWTAAPLLECLQEVTGAYDASVASIPKLPGLWNLLEVEDHAVSLNPSETQWYHLLPSLLEDNPDEMNVLGVVQNVCRMKTSEVCVNEGVIHTNIC